MHKDCWCFHIFGHGFAAFTCTGVETCKRYVAIKAPLANQNRVSRLGHLNACSVMGMGARFRTILAEKNLKPVPPFLIFSDTAM